MSVAGPKPLESENIDLVGPVVDFQHLKAPVRFVILRKKDLTGIIVNPNDLDLSVIEKRNFLSAHIGYSDHSCKCPHKTTGGNRLTIRYGYGPQETQRRTTSSPSYFSDELPLYRPRDRQ